MERAGAAWTDLPTQPGRSKAPCLGAFAIGSTSARAWREPREVRLLGLPRDEVRRWRFVIGRSSRGSGRGGSLIKPRVGRILPRQRLSLTRSAGAAIATALVYVHAESIQSDADERFKRDCPMGPVAGRSALPLDDRRGCEGRGLADGGGCDGWGGGGGGDWGDGGVLIRGEERWGERNGSASGRSQPTAVAGGGHGGGTGGVLGACPCHSSHRREPIARRERRREN
jgi:hypothetical protein